MALRLAIEAGHGLYTAGKRCLKSLDSKETREWTLNDRIVRYTIQGINEYQNVTVLRVDDPTGKSDIALGARASKVNAFKPDIMLSMHHDAGIAGGSGGGITVYRTPGSSSASKKYQSALYQELIKQTGLKGNRSTPLGLANFYIIRNVKAPALLIEHGFMDSRSDVPVILSDRFARQAASAHVAFLVREFGLKKKSGSTPSKPVVTPVTPNIKVFKLGDRGNDVKGLQSDLARLGYKLSVDGSFGPGTLEEVKRFQGDNKLVVDGYAGKATQSKIKELLNSSSTGEWFRVRSTWADAGSQKSAYRDLNGAIEECKKHKGFHVYNSKGIQVYPELGPTPDNLYRVRKSWANASSQKGAFAVKQSAIDEAKVYPGYKVYDSKGAIVYPLPPEKVEPKPSPKPGPITPSPVLRIPIAGKSVASAQQMATLLKKKNPNAKIKISPEEFCKLFIEEGEVEGIRGDIAFCQAMKETGWLSYGNLVLPEQNNYAGIGATNNSGIGKGNWFDTERLGIRAQIQHLKAYANKEPLVNENIDPRFRFVTRGIAPNWTDLNGRWAVPGTTYGQDIVKHYEELLKVVVGADLEDTTGEVEELQHEIDKLNAELKKYKGQISSIKDIVSK